MRGSLLLLVTLFAAAGCRTSNHAPQPSAAPAAPTAAPAAQTTTESAKAEPAAKDELSCQRGKEERWLSIENVQPKGCKLNYPQTTSAVAWSSHGVQHCEQVRDRIKSKLEEAGFKCAPSTANAATSSPNPASAVTAASTPEKK